MTIESSKTSTTTCGTYAPGRCATGHRELRNRAIIVAVTLALAHVPAPAHATEHARSVLPFPLIGQTDVPAFGASGVDRTMPQPNGEGSLAVVRTGDFTAQLGIEPLRRARASEVCPPGDPCPALVAVDFALWLHGDAQGGLTAWLTPNDWFEFVSASTLESHGNETNPNPAVVAAPSSPPPTVERPAPAISPAQSELVTPRTEPAQPTQAHAPTPAHAPQSESLFAWLIATLIALAMLLVPWWLLRRRQRAQAVTECLNAFYNRVDLAKQQHVHDAKAFDEQVQKAFEYLHQEIRLMLQKRQIRIADLKKKVLWFHSPDPPAGTRWSPPTLSQLGYVLAAADRFRADAAVLALYKYSGEESTNGGIVDSYTIVKEGASTEFSAAFAAKIRSPYAMALRVPDSVNTPPNVKTATAPAQAPDAAANPVEVDEAETEHNVAYVFSLASRVDANTLQRLQKNLAALAQLATTPGQAASSPLPTHQSLRSLLSDDLSQRKPELGAAHAALRRKPHLLVAALADLHRQQVIDERQLQSLLIHVDAALATASASILQERATRMQTLARTLQTLPALADGQVLRNPGATYVDARGADTDARFMLRMAQLAASSLLPTQRPGPALVVTSHLTDREWRARLGGYAALMPGEENRAALSTLMAALDTRALALHQVDDGQPLKVAEILRSQHATAEQYLVLATDLALTMLDGMPPQLHYVLWTLTSQALIVDAAVRDELINGSRALRAHGRIRPTPNAHASV